MNEYILSKDGFYMVSPGPKFPLWQIDPDRAVRYATREEAKQHAAKLTGRVTIVSVPKKEDE
jgi:hypothetical protein